MSAWKDCFWCHNGHYSIYDLAPDNHKKEDCPFCGGRSGEYITEEEARRIILEKELNKHE